MYLQNEGVLRHETLQLFLFLFLLRHMKRPALQNKQAGVLRMAFRARKDFGTLEKRAPGARTVLLVTEYRDVFFPDFNLCLYVWKVVLSRVTQSGGCALTRQCP